VPLAAAAPGGYASGCATDRAEGPWEVSLGEAPPARPPSEEAGAAVLRPLAPALPLALPLCQLPGITFSPVLRLQEAARPTRASGSNGSGAAAALPPQLPPHKSVPLCVAAAAEANRAKGCRVQAADEEFAQSAWNNSSTLFALERDSGNKCGCGE